MNDWLLIAGGTISTIVVGALSSALWEWLRDTISITSAKYIDIRGDWSIASSYEHVDGAVDNFKERLLIKQQFGRRFRGLIFSPHPTNPEDMIELDVRGEFKDKFHVVFSYDHRTSRLTDVGAGTFQINADHTTAEGASVNFGVSSPKKPAVIRFNMIKIR